MLSDERDLIRLRDGVKRLFAVATHPAFDRVSEGIYPGSQYEEIEQSEQISVNNFKNDDELDSWLMKFCEDTQHGTGTCRMGDIHDRNTVVDSNGRVVGVSGLRVVDASIMPQVVRANTHLTTVMIAEYMADRIKGEL